MGLGDNSKDVTQIHQVNKTLKETYNVPGHAPRSRSDVFTATRKQLVDISDTPCYICGVRQSTMKDANQNLYGSTQMEQHHCIVEYALANAVDWDILKQEHPDFPDWDKVDSTDAKTYKYFVDSAYNSKILCDVHHRGTNRGIHAIEYPVWLAQKYVQKTFNFIPLTKGIEPLLPDMD